MSLTRAKTLPVLILFPLLGGCMDMLFSASYLHYSTQWLRTQRAEIVAAGTVVNDAGSPLDDVTVTAVTISPQPSGSPGDSCHRDERYERRRTVSRTFRFEAPRASSLTLTFEKAGHEPRTLSLKVAPTTQAHCRESESQRAPSAEAVRREDLVVTLPRRR